MFKNNMIIPCDFFSSADIEAMRAASSGGVHPEFFVLITRIQHRLAQKGRERLSAQTVETLYRIVSKIAKDHADNELGKYCLAVSRKLEEYESTPMVMDFEAEVIELLSKLCADQPAGS